MDKAEPMNSNNQKPIEADGLLVEAAPAASDTQLRRVSELAALLILRRSEAEEAERHLKNAKNALAQVEEIDLPTAMLDCGLMAFTDTNGAKIELKTSYHASIPKDRADEAFAWLTGAGHGSIIKHDVAVQFPRDAAQLAAQCVALLQEKFSAFKITDKEHVAPNTLSALVKEQIGLGADIPLDLLGVFTRRYADVKLPKIKKDGL